MTMLNASTLEVPAWMTLNQAGNILEPQIRNADWRQVLLDAIEDGIEMRQATPNGGVIPLPAKANLHLKPDDVDWVSSQIPVNRILYDGTHASDVTLSVRISRADFMERFKRLLPVEQYERPALNMREDRRKPHRQKGSSYDKPDAEIIECMRPLVQDQGMMPTLAVKTLLKQGVRLAGNSAEESKIRRIVDKYKERYGE